MQTSTRARSRRPTHPGVILREDVLPVLGWSQGEFAKKIGVNRVTVSRLLNEHLDVSAEMAVRLERVLGTSAELWLNMQQAVDLWDARARRRHR